MLLVFIIGIIILILLDRFNVYKNKYLKTFFRYIIYSLIISSFLEVTLFNFRHYESMIFKDEKELVNYNLFGITCDNVCHVTDKENAYIEIFNIDSEISNLYLDIQSKDNLYLKYKIDFTDEANKLYADGGSRYYVNNIEESHYIRMHTSGKSEALKLTILEDNNNFTINEIKINKEVPMFINNLRLILTFVFSLLIFIINPKSILYELKFDFKKGKVITVVIISVLGLVLCSNTLLCAKSYNDNETSQYSQYKNLAKALSKGHFYLDLKVSDKLKELENPYDISYRDNYLKPYKDYYWDYAYYNQKYYSYFGVVPCLLTYLPFRLITHSDLPNYIAMSISLIFLLISVYKFMYTLIKKYFPKTSFIWYQLLSLFLLVTSGLFIFSAEPTFYNLPIIFGLSFSYLGLSFWFKSTNDKSLNKKYLALGSLCLSLVAGCRPQLLVGSFLALPIFWDYVFKKRELFSKSSLKETLCLCLPFVIVALFIMYYNYARFGSIFDFGANYNLTTNDMTKRGFRFDRIFLGLYYFLFAPGRISLVFPFVISEEVLTSYVGVTIFENMYGGFFFINIITLLGLCFSKFKKVINNKVLSNMCLTLVISALLVVLADTQMAGILPRYLSDFGWLLSLSTIIVILSLVNSRNFKIDYKKLIVTFIVISLIFNFFTIFLDKESFNNSLINLIYYKMYYLFMFWL